MSDDQKAESEPETTRPKKTYEPPRLTEYGKVVELTHGAGVALVNDDLVASIL